MMVLWVILAGLVVAIGYVRLAPSDPVKWHVSPEASQDRDFARGVTRVLETGPGGLARFDAIARTTPRTVVLAGSVDTGMVTYVTRSVVWGFPDYTTARQDGDQLRIYARSRFGRKDFGVNRARVEGWLAALQAG
ncbi:DUF1499 domain-containing protein [Seohaeicola saemankumensis]|nr:DUF1499 domain-containing protein [Seohaeicola saemankumensis]MCA0872027.1 DUF1499 domain-containing protein [Seohaeicola saemankumensis]